MISTTAPPPIPELAGVQLTGPSSVQPFGHAQTVVNVNP